MGCTQVKTQVRQKEAIAVHPPTRALTTKGSSRLTSFKKSRGVLSANSVCTQEQKTIAVFSPKSASGHSAKLRENSQSFFDYSTVREILSPQTNDRSLGDIEIVGILATLEKSVTVATTKKQLKPRVVTIPEEGNLVGKTDSVFRSALNRSSLYKSMQGILNSKCVLERFNENEGLQLQQQEANNNIDKIQEFVVEDQEKFMNTTDRKKSRLEKQHLRHHTVNFCNEQHHFIRQKAQREVQKQQLQNNHVDGEDEEIEGGEELALNDRQRQKSRHLGGGKYFYRSSSSNVSATMYSSVAAKQSTNLVEFSIEEIDFDFKENSAKPHCQYSHFSVKSSPTNK